MIEPRGFSADHVIRLHAMQVAHSIAGGHLFDNGNKRTAFEAVKLFRKRNQIFTGTSDPQLRETVRLVATHLLSDLQQIARSLKGF